MPDERPYRASLPFCPRYCMNRIASLGGTSIPAATVREVDFGMMLGPFRMCSVLAYEVSCFIPVASSPNQGQ